MDYWVEFKVPSITGDQKHKQGPWPKEKAREQLRGIAGWDGVREARLRQVCGIAPCKEPDCAACGAE